MPSVYLQNLSLLSGYFFISSLYRLHSRFLFSSPLGISELQTKFHVNGVVQDNTPSASRSDHMRSYAPRDTIQFGQGHMTSKHQMILFYIPQVDALLQRKSPPGRSDVLRKSATIPAIDFTG